MDTKLLEVFLAVVHTGSISAAARRLNFSQPTVSQQMKALERIMDVQLFHREGGRIELTAAGRALQGYAETTLSSWRFVCEQVREAAGRDDLETVYRAAAAEQAQLCGHVLRDRRFGSAGAVLRGMGDEVERFAVLRDR